jgi:hypothetical protein
MSLFFYKEKKITFFVIFSNLLRLKLVFGNAIYSLIYSCSLAATWLIVGSKYPQILHSKRTGRQHALEENAETFSLASWLWLWAWISLCIK